MRIFNIRYWPKSLSYGCQDSTACPFHKLHLRRWAGGFGRPAAALVVNDELPCSPASSNAPRTYTQQPFSPLLSAKNEFIEPCLFQALREAQRWAEMDPPRRGDGADTKHQSPKGKRIVRAGRSYSGTWKTNSTRRARVSRRNYRLGEAWCRVLKNLRHSAW